MTIKITIFLGILLVFLILIIGFNQWNLSNTKQMQNTIFQKKYKIFSADYDISFVSKENKRYTPSDQDVQNGIQILENFLKNNSAIQDLGKYKIQFFGYTDKDNKKILWANFFCNDHGRNWKKEPIFVKDGGNCYFNVKVNLDTKEVFDFIINGEA